MKAVGLVVFILISGMTLESQSVTFTEEPRPFHINRGVVTGLPKLGKTRIRITGTTMYGEEVPLFMLEDTTNSDGIEFFFYFDDSIHNLEIEVSSSGSIPARFEYSGQRNPYRVTVFIGSGLTLAQLPGYTVTSTSGQLQPGDILVLGAEGVAEPSKIEGIKKGTLQGFLNRGIHIISAAPPGTPSRTTSPEQESLWTGRLLILDSVNPASVANLLEQRRRWFSSFKKRYYDLVAKADFYGIPASPIRNLTYVNARVEDIAISLERRYLSDRLNLVHKLLLLGFYLPGIIFLALLGRTKPLLILLGVVLSVWIPVSVMIPEQDRTLELRLNPGHLEAEELELARTVTRGSAEGSLLDLFPPVVEQQRFNAPDFQGSNWTLSYRVLRSNRKKAALEAYSRAAAVKFNQIPQIEKSGDGYYLKYVNPLRSWSLDEPD